MTSQVSDRKGMEPEILLNENIYSYDSFLSGTYDTANLLISGTHSGSGKRCNNYANYFTVKVLFQATWHVTYCYFSPNSIFSYIVSFCWHCSRFHF